MKQCKVCLQSFDLSGFYKNAGCLCKSCANKRTTEYAKNNKHKIQPKLKKYALKRRYGISELEYLDLLQKQDNLCAICGCLETSLDAKTNLPKALAVDHCHITNKVRGLLCSKCNVGLGNFRDSIFNLEKAIKYLNDSK